MSQVHHSMERKLASIFDELWNEVAWLHHKWSEYRVLFGTKKSRVDLLNVTFPSFARIIQDSLWQDILLHIARLTDPPKSRGKPNLTIQLLPEEITDAEAKAAVTFRVMDALAASEFCRDWRNRHIAHRDLHLVLDAKAKPLKPASRQKVNDALTSLSGVLNAVSEHYLDSEISFDMKAHCGGAMDILYLIDDGAKAAREKEKHLLSGNYSFDNFKSPDI
ncbi:MAG: hypothetical protein ABI865_08910 [Nitrosospira sp.]